MSTVTQQDSVSLNDFEREFNPLDDLAVYHNGQQASAPGRDIPAETEQQAAPEEPPQEASPVEETPAPPAPVEEDKTDALSDKWENKFRRLSEKERNIRQEEQRLKAQQAQLQQLADFQRELAENPARAIARLGVDPAKIYEEKVREDAGRPDREIQAIREEAKREVASLRSEIQKMQVMQNAAAWEADYERSINSEDYALVRAIDPTGEIVREHALEHWNKTGKLLHPSRILATLKAEAETMAKALEKSGYVVAKAQTATNDRAKVQATPQKTTTLTTQAVNDDSRRASLPFGIDDELDIERLTAKFGG